MEVRHERSEQRASGSKLLKLKDLDNEVCQEPEDWADMESLAI